MSSGPKEAHARRATSALAGSQKALWDPKHTHMEHMCSHCFVRSLSQRPSYRACGHPMSSATNLIPPQWLLVGATAAMLDKYETAQLLAALEPPPAPTTSDIQVPALLQAQSISGLTLHATTGHSPSQCRCFSSVPQQVLPQARGATQPLLIACPKMFFGSGGSSLSCTYADPIHSGYQCPPLYLANLCQ